jgi:hypothetical protein
MSKKTILLSLILLVLASQLIVAETKVVTLPEINKPDRDIYMDNERLYVTESTTINIYSLKDFKLIKRFGKQGEGPREFKIDQQRGLGSVILNVHTDAILVNSVGRLSWFKKDGTFIKEMKLPNPFSFALQPFGNNFVGLGLEQGKVIFWALNIYDENLIKIKTLAKSEHTFQRGKGLKVLATNPTHAVYKDKLYTAWENDIDIKVYDTGLKELYAIKHSLKRVKVTEDDKKKIIDYLKNTPPSKDYFEFLKPIKFPDFYPSVWSIFVTGDILYVMTFSSDDSEEGIQKYDILLFDLKGKFLKKIVLPLKMKDPLLPSPFIIHKGKLYQLVENEDEEEWELHISEIK